MEGAEPEIQLKALGLTEYESKAYTTLLRHGTLTAERISELGGIPLPRVYDTITELQKKGFILISRTRPKLFRPLVPKKALENYLDLQYQQSERRLAGLKDSVSAAVNLLNTVSVTPTTGENAGTWSIEKRSNILRMLQDEASNSKKEILIFSGDLSWVGEVASVLRAAVKRGVKLRVLMHKTNMQSALSNAKLVKKIGGHIRIGYTGLLRGQVIDGKRAHIATKFTNSGINVLEETRQDIPIDTRYETVIFSNPAFIDAFRQYFEFWWEKLKK